MSSLHAALTALADEWAKWSSPLQPPLRPELAASKIRGILAEHAPTSEPTPQQHAAGGIAGLLAVHGVPVERVEVDGRQVYPASEPTLTEDERESITSCDCGHDIGGQHNSTGCYARDYPAPGQTVRCPCTETDDRVGVNFAAVERILRGRLAAVEEQRDRALETCCACHGVAKAEIAALRQQLEEALHAQYLAEQDRDDHAAQAEAAEAEISALRQQVDDLRAERDREDVRLHAEWHRAEVRAEAAEQTVAAQAQVIERTINERLAAYQGLPYLPTLIEFRNAIRVALDAAPTPPADRGEVGTGAGEGATGQDTGTAWVTRSTDCPEAPAQAHLPAPTPPAETEGLAVVDDATDPCPAPGYADRHTAVGAGAITSPYSCHGCGALFTIPAPPAGPEGIPLSPGGFITGWTDNAPPTTDTHTWDPETPCPCGRPDTCPATPPTTDAEEARTDG